MEVTFDIRSIGSDRIIDQKYSFPDFQARTTENVCYFDNITFLQNQEQQVEVQQALPYITNGF
jgi:hypothetical protein